MLPIPACPPRRPIAKTCAPRIPRHRPDFRSTFGGFPGSGVWLPTTRSTTPGWRTSLPATRPIRQPGKPRSRGRSVIRGSATRSPICCRPSSAAAAPRPKRSPRGAAARPANGRHRHRPAGRTLRRAAVHAAQGAHRHPARRAGPRRTGSAGGRGLLDRRRGSRLGRGQALRRARRRARPSRRSRSATRRAPHEARSRASAWTTRRPRARGARTRPAANRVHGRPARQSLARAYQPGAGMADAFGRWLESVLGPRGLVVYDAADPAAKPLVADVFAREIEHAGRNVAAGAREAGAALQARGYHAQATPHEGSLALFHLNGGREPIRHAGRRVSGRRAHRLEGGDLLDARPPVARPSSAPTCCCGRSCRTRCSRRSVTSPARTSWRISASSSGVYEAFGVPMPLIQQRATATLLDANAMRFLTRHELPARSRCGRRTKRR